MESEYSDEFFRRMYNIPSFHTFKPKVRVAHEKPGKDINEPKVAIPRLDKAIENHAGSRAACKDYECVRSPESVCLDSSGQAIKVRREYDFTRKLWKNKVKEFQEESKVQEKLIEELIDDEKELRNAHIDFNELVISDVYKQKRCLQTLEDADKVRGEKNEEIEKLTMNIEKLKRARDSLTINIEKYKMFMDYLYDYLVTDKKFKNIDSIVKRYDELSVIRHNIVKEQFDTIMETDRVRNAKARYLEITISETLGYQNQLRMLQEKYFYYRHEAFYWERTRDHVRKGCLSQMRTTQKLVQCGYNIYEDIYLRMNKPVTIKMNDKIRLFQELKHLLLFFEEFVEHALYLYKKEGDESNEDDDSDLSLEKKEVKKSDSELALASTMKMLELAKKNL